MEEGQPIPVAKIRQFQLPYDGVPFDVFEGVLREEGFMLMDFEPCDQAGCYILYVAVYGTFIESVARYQMAMTKCADKLTSTMVLPPGVTRH